MTSHFFAAAASVALIGSGFASVDGIRSYQALPMHQVNLAADGTGGGNTCRVDVVRSGVAGTADITRHVETNGTCVCTVTTGNASSNGSAENIVTGLLRDRTCDGAPAPGRAVAESAAGGGGSGAVLPLLITTVGAAGLAVALGSDSKG